MSAVRFNDSMFPLIIVNFPDDLTFEDAVAGNERIGAYLARQKPFVLVNDYGNANLTLDMQRHTDAFIRTNREANRAYCMGVVAVSASAMVRTVGKTFALIYKPPFPVVFCADMQSGYAKARGLMLAHRSAHSAVCP